MVSKLTKAIHVGSQEKRMKARYKKSCQLCKLAEAIKSAQLKLLRSERCRRYSEAENGFEAMKSYVVKKLHKVNESCVFLKLTAQISYEKRWLAL